MRNRKKKRDAEKGRKRKGVVQRNISPRSADAICSPVVKGRSVGSVCANSCELTAYIGLPFRSFLASPRLALHYYYRVSVFVCLYPHPFSSLRYYCAPRIPRVKTGGRFRSRFKAVRKNRPNSHQMSRAHT